ncbi:hypothetical protein RAJCM14343_1691 [Rhodococcus aetherivorans]|uniref:Uncharacterized protein n=1 Tax=Rhodococcus aetherivorans TaxID=191292 RepID=A0ABQ0YJ12_9NOCA|nr:MULTISPECIES: hypothetical protein [Rhodococcus]ETT28372.1 hypothetical protein RR21198_1024 [Rhodococcus rhodochrous ATCC 21198]NGP29824.1 hypothetical protein [Rhodococcus aetherivorans]PND53465.1 hypothetical protein CQZ88_03155 [Rhodococcus sp. ENV425]GES36440.1 hypothetical protein RAJCM14343_1691 [Rhodococcus aetherivorans]
MPEHKQMQPPDYHRCLETVFASPTACRELLERLARTREIDLRSKWSPWRGQEPPPHGPEVKRQVPAEVQLLMVEAKLAGERASFRRLWRELYDLMGVPPMQESNVELIVHIRSTLDRLKSRVRELEEAVAAKDDPDA